MVSNIFTLKNFISGITLTVMLTLSYVIPKKNNCLAFLPHHNNGKFSGNLKYLYLYTVKHHKDLDCCWLTNVKTTHEDLLKNGYNSKLYKIYPCWSILRSKFIILDQTDAMLAFGRFKIIQLWHGFGFKNIGFCDTIIRESYIKSIIHKAAFSKFSLIIANCLFDHDKKILSFQNQNVVITGFPRNDIFLINEDQKINYKMNMGLSNFKKIILYAPTHRRVGFKNPFSEDFWKELQDWLIESKNVFLIKRHPLDKNLVIPKDYPNILNASFIGDDIQELLCITDILITDYSSVATDFLLTEKPILFYTYDLDDYQKTSHSLFCDLREVFPGPYIFNEQDLLSKIKDISWGDEKDYRSQYKNILDRFYKFKDGESSKRIINQILELQ